MCCHWCQKHHCRYPVSWSLASQFHAGFWQIGSPWIIAFNGGNDLWRLNGWISTYLTGMLNGVLAQKCFIVGTRISKKQRSKVFKFIWLVKTVRNVLPCASRRLLWTASLRQIVIVHQTVISRKESNVRGIFPNKQLQSQFRVFPGSLNTIYASIFWTL